MRVPHTVGQAARAAELQPLLAATVALVVAMFATQGRLLELVLANSERMLLSQTCSPHLLAEGMKCSRLNAGDTGRLSSYAKFGGYVSGRIAIATGDFNRAIPLLEGTRPLNPLGAYWLALAYELADQHSMALNTCERFDCREELIQHGKQELRRSQYIMARHIFQLSIDLKDDGDGWAGLGEALLGLGETGEAKDAFENALKDETTVAWALFRLGDIAGANGQWDDAIHYYQCSVLENPLNSGAEIGLVMSKYEITKDHEEAIEQLSDIVRRFPQDMWGYLRLGRLLSELSRYDEADEWFVLAEQRFPDEFAVSSWWGFSMLDRKDYHQAVALFSAACRKRPNDPDPHIWLASAMHLSGDNEGADRELALATAKSGGDPLALESVGDLYVQMGQLESALASYRAALAGAPTRERLLERLGSLSTLEPLP